MGQSGRKEFFGEDVIGKPADFYFEGEQDTYKKVQPLFDGERRYDLCGELAAPQGRRETPAGLVGPDAEG